VTFSGKMGEKNISKGKVKHQFVAKNTATKLTCKIRSNLGNTYRRT